MWLKLELLVVDVQWACYYAQLLCKLAIVAIFNFFVEEN